MFKILIYGAFPEIVYVSDMANAQVILTQSVMINICLCYIPALSACTYFYDSFCNCVEKTKHTQLTESSGQFKHCTYQSLIGNRNISMPYLFLCNVVNND